MSASDFAKALNPLALMQQAQTMEMNRMRMDQMKFQQEQLEKQKVTMADNQAFFEQNKSHPYYKMAIGNFDINTLQGSMNARANLDFYSKVPDIKNTYITQAKAKGLDDNYIKDNIQAFDNLLKTDPEAAQRRAIAMATAFTRERMLETERAEQEMGRMEIGEKLSRVMASGSVVELDSLKRDIESGEYNLTPAQVSLFNNMWGSLSAATGDREMVNMLVGTPQQQKQIVANAEKDMVNNPTEANRKRYENLNKTWDTLRRERGAALEANAFASKFLKEKPDAQKFEGATAEMLMRKYPELKFEQATAVLSQLAFRKEDEVRKATTKVANQNYAKAYKGEPSRVLANAVSIPQSDKEKKAMGLFTGMELQKTNHPVTKEQAIAYVPSDRSKVYYVTKNPNGTKRISAFALSEEGAYAPMGEGVDISSKDFFEDHFNTLSFLEDPNKMTASTLTSIKDFIQENVVNTITTRPDRRGPLMKVFIDPKTKEKISSGPIRDVGVALNNILMSSHPLISTKRSKKEPDVVLAKDVAKQIMDLYLDAVISKNLGM